MNTETTNRKKILVIDDNPGVLFAVKQALQFKDYEVLTAESFEGVPAVEACAPDLIYLDISLVGQSGQDVSRALKGDAGTKHIPIVILTAYANADELAKEAGADDYLPKPFELTHLWEMTEKYA